VTSSDIARRKSYRLAMSAGRNGRYRIVDIRGRHFVETGKQARLGSTTISQVICEVPALADDALEKGTGSNAR